jgi:hypothetical protein
MFRRSPVYTSVHGLSTQMMVSLFEARSGWQQRSEITMEKRSSSR